MTAELVALLVVWSIAAACWWVQHISPIEYVERAHKAEQRVSELEGEVAALQEYADKLVAQLERSVYYG